MRGEREGVREEKEKIIERKTKREVGTQLGWSYACGTQTNRGYEHAFPLLT